MTKNVENVRSRRFARRRGPWCWRCNGLTYKYYIGLLIVCLCVNGSRIFSLYRVIEYSNRCYSWGGPRVRNNNVLSVAPALACTREKWRYCLTPMSTVGTIVSSMNHASSRVRNPAVYTMLYRYQCSVMYGYRFKTNSNDRGPDRVSRIPGVSRWEVFFFFRFIGLGPLCR
jgi:hypothetical protein